MYEGLRHYTFDECRDRYVAEARAFDSIRLTIILKGSKNNMGCYQDGDEIVLVYDRVSRKPFLIVERTSINKEEDVAKCQEFVTGLEEKNYAVNVEVNETRGFIDIIFVNKETYELLSANC